MTPDALPATPAPLLRGLLALCLLTLLSTAGLWWHLPSAQDAVGVRWQGVERLWMRDVHGIMRTQQAEAVSLPDSWKPAGLKAAGVGRWRLHLAVSSDVVRRARHEPWALRIDHLHDVHRIWINGELLHSTLPRPGWLGLPSPWLIDLPGRLLQPGPNTLEIEIQALQQGGLSAVALAPKALLQPGHTLLRLLTRDALIALNLIWIAFSLFVVTLWWLRRQEAAAGLFGLLMLIGGLRNCRILITEDLGLSLSAESWLLFAAHVLTACLQGWLVMALVERRLRWFNRSLWGVLISFLLLGLIALLFEPALTHTRGVLQGVLILMLLPSIWLMSQWVRRAGLRPSMRSGLALGWAALLTASLHDFVFNRLIGHVDVQFWMGWMLPLASASFVLMVVHRVAQAFNDIEAANLHLEHKVSERTRELAQANAAKSHFLASASHDLRQPVAAIGLITDLLRAKVHDPMVLGLTERLTRAVRSMEAMLKSLLDLSRLDSHALPVQRQRVRLQALLDAIVSHEAEAAMQKNLRLRVRPTPAVVWSDPVLLEQVLRNLVGNAVSHTQQGGVLVGVRRRSAAPPSPSSPPEWIWQVQVWDSGNGIALADQSRIFDAFVQLGNPGRDRAKGLGLGLAIVRRATTLLQHPLQLRSQPGHGSCFTVSLPDAGPPVPEVLPPAPATQPPDLAGLRVLVVEDDEPLSDSLALWLSNWGAQALIGHNLKWARAQASLPWDLVISDHRLPDGSGRDVIEHLRRSHPNLPALIITGDTSPGQITELARSNVPVLHKPFRAEQLHTALAQCLQGADGAPPDRLSARAPT